MAVKEKNKHAERLIEEEPLQVKAKDEPATEEVKPAEPAVTEEAATEAAIAEEAVAQTVPEGAEPAGENAAEAVVTDNKPVHKISANGLRWIYFGVSLVYLGLIALIVVALQRSYTVFGITLDVAYAQGVAEKLKNFTGMVFADQVALVLSLLCALYFVAYGIAMLVRSILALVHFFCLLGKPKYKKVEARFRKASRNFAHILGYTLIINLFMVATGTPYTTDLIVTLIVTGVFFFGQCAWGNYLRLRENGEMNLKNYLLEFIPMLAFVAFGAAIVSIATSPYLVAPYDAILKLYGFDPASMASVLPGIIAIVAGGVIRFIAMILALNYVENALAYYPYNDYRNAKKNQPIVQKKAMGRTIAVFILLAVSIAAFQFGGVYASLHDLLTDGLIGGTLALLASIALFVGAKMDTPKEEDEDEEEEEDGKKSKKKAKKGKTEEEEDEE